MVIDTGSDSPISTMLGASSGRLLRFIAEIIFDIVLLLLKGFIEFA
jgi:hypothetical protein